MAICFQGPPEQANTFRAGMSKSVFLVAKVKPLVAKPQNIIKINISVPGAIFLF